MKIQKHPLHSMSSYLGSYPPRVPRRLIQEYTKEGETILDPFCGGGTTLVEAGLAGRVGIGIDKNPLAAAIACAKTSQVALPDVLARLQDLAEEYEYEDRALDCSADIRVIFHDRTIDQLVYLRSSLTDEPEDVFIRGAVLGILHGKHRKGGGSMYLSIDMPNTFSMSPAYVRKFVAKHNLAKIPFDVFSKTRERVRELLRTGAAAVVPGSKVLFGDATKADQMLPKGSIDAVICSPPYLGVLRYGAFNWIRLWFLGFGPSEVDRALDSTDSMDRYLAFMASTLRALETVVRPGGILVFAIGDVEEMGHHVALAPRVWEELGGLVGFDLVEISTDTFDQTTKTTRIWGEERKGQATKVERVLVLRRSNTALAECSLDKKELDRMASV